MRILTPGCYGKIRVHGDFVRHNAELFLSFGLETWLEEGIHHGRRSLGSRWDEVYRTLRPLRFAFYVPEHGTTIIGSIAPSEDRVGRQFPIFVFVALELDEQAGWESALPVQCDEFLHAAEDIADLGGRGVDLAGFKGHIESLRGLTEFDEARRKLDDYCASSTFESFLRCIVDDPTQDSGIQWLGNVAAAVGGDAVPRYVLQSSCATDPYWIGALMRIVARTGHGMRPRLVIWDRHHEGAMIRGIYDSLEPRYLMPMLFPKINNDYGWDVSPTTEGNVPCPDSVRERITPMLQREGASIGEVIEALVTT